MARALTATRADDHHLVVRAPTRGWSARVPPRALGMTVAVLSVTFAVFAWSLAVGEFPITVADVLATLAGSGSADGAFIVGTLRLPRGITAALVGAAFGMAGAIFQRLARNPLATPDVIGINAGAAAGAVLAIVALDGGGVQVTAAALVGGLGAAAVVAGLASRNGLSGYRLVLIGIGVTAALTAATSYLLTRAEIYDAQRALVWLTGSLNGRGWEHVRPVGLALALLGPVALAAARQLRLLELGDDLATGLGARVARARLALLLAGTALAAVSTVSAGPIAFVALAAPQIARRLLGGGAPGLLPAAACGALLLVASDLVARRVLAPTELPVGIVTAILGAPYLLALLARANRIGSAG